MACYCEVFHDASAPLTVQETRSVIATSAARTPASATQVQMSNLRLPITGDCFASLAMTLLSLFLSSREPHLNFREGDIQRR